MRNITGFKWSRAKDRRLETLTVPWSPASEKLASDAREAIRKDERYEALNCLFKIDVPDLNNETTLIVGRLAQYDREIRHGIKSHESATTELNRVRKDILSLVTAVEKSLEEEGKVNARIRFYLIKRYQNRLDQKLTGRKPINIQITPSKKGTSKETSSYFINLGSGDNQADILSVFEKSEGRLLVTGKPGAGKTILMLKLVLALLKDKVGVLPILLNLASWQSSFFRFETWLEQVLPAEMGVNTPFARRTIGEAPLVLLLDGLDEVSENDRESCLMAIGRFFANSKNQFVIASRIKEYKTIKKDAPVFLQVKVGPLKIGQIKAELLKVGYEQPEAMPLLNATKEDTLLKEVMKVPFYFNALQYILSRHIKLSELKSKPQKRVEFEKVIVKKFINEQLSCFESDWSKEDLKFWTSFLASRLNQRNLIRFELEHLQYSWWQWSRSQKAIGRLIYWIPLWLFWGVMAGVLFGYLSGKVLVGVISGASLVAFLFLEDLKNLEFPPIDTKGKFSWSWMDIRNLLIILVAACFIGLLIGIIFGLITENLVMPDLGPTIPLHAWALFGMLLTLFLSIMTIAPYYFIRSYPKMIKINKPYQRFWLSLKRFNFSILQHLHLRYLLYNKRLLPFRFVKFLNKLTEHYILESDGASWQFRHRIIQDYFAEIWKEEENQGE